MRITDTGSCHHHHHHRDRSCLTLPSQVHPLDNVHNTLQRELELSGCMTGNIPCVDTRGVTLLEMIPTASEFMPCLMIMVEVRVMSRPCKFSVVHISGDETVPSVVHISGDETVPAGGQIKVRFGGDLVLVTDSFSDCGAEENGRFVVQMQHREWLWDPATASAKFKPHKLLDDKGQELPYPTPGRTVFPNDNNYKPLRGTVGFSSGRHEWSFEACDII